jgi:hypothetical protein
VEHFGQTGSIPDLYAHYGIDTNAIVAAAAALTPGRPMRHLRALPEGGLSGSETHQCWVTRGAVQSIPATQRPR